MTQGFPACGRRQKAPQGRIGASSASDLPDSFAMEVDIVVELKSEIRRAPEEVLDSTPKVKGP